ncbi:MAG: histidinol-phosphatase HisJ family protein [Lachnospiraceae bacterium]|nr:histidinol-phosphatase HisJ family protein [Lachnospiraceae bacterium]
MLIGDVHVHSVYSEDSETPVEENIKAAIEKRLPYICITDHIDWDYPVEDLVFDFDVAAYVRELTDLKAKYANSIKVLIGVELGMQPQLAERYDALLKAYPFDFVIGSQHLVDGMDPYYPETMAGRSMNSVLRQYFEEMLENIRLFHSFDSLGHLDYIVRYGKAGDREYAYEDYADVIDEILKTLIRYEIALEVNTAGIRKKLGHPNPHTDVLKRYKALGGSLITVGSDSHKAYSVGYAFGKTATLLRELGFEHVVVYEKRMPQLFKI